MTGTVRLEVDGPIAVIVNDNPAKHNAFTDDMDVQLFELLADLKGRKDVRAVVWRGEGASWSSGRDVAAIGADVDDLTHHELMRRGHQGIAPLLDLDVPVIVAIQGWALGGSFQRALLCDVRIASEDARFRLPEVSHGVIADTGGVSRLFQICGPGVVSDMVLTGRTLDAQEALSLGIVSRVVAREALEDVAMEMAGAVASAPWLTVKMARKVISHLSVPQVRASLEDELILQTFVKKSDDFAEFKAARAEGRTPNYTGS
jgi:enoyl-CoA hydratase/carnithine racemase